jgi:predicted Zn-dependent protease
MNRRLLKSLWILTAITLFASCGTKRVTPITGRTYRIAEGAFSDAKMLQGAKTFYYGTYIPQMGGDSRDKQKTAMVKNVANKLIRVTTDYLRNNGYADELKYYEWDVHLVPAPGQINATCMAGGKILVFEDILPIAKNEAGLAAILGHEIGHAIAHHVAQRNTQQAKKGVGQMLGAIGLSILGEVTGGGEAEVGEVINQTVDLSNEVMEFFEMKYSRKHEHEADHIGMILMAMAGYDPHEAPKVWTRMTEYTGDFTNRILSTHPSNAKRQRWMEQKWMDEAMSYYNNRGGRRSNQVVSQNTTSHKKSEQASSKGTTYTVKVSKLNVRSAPSATNSRIVGSLSSGQTVKVSSINNGWATIIYNGKTCYVKADYLRVSR